MKVFDASTDTVDDALAFLNEEGFLLIRNGLRSEQIDSIRNRFRDFVGKNESHLEAVKDSDGHFPRLINLHVALPELVGLYSENAFALKVQDKFFATRSTIYTTLYYERGSAQPLHRDTPYFTTRPIDRYLGVWVPLEDADSENGCLEVVPRAHLLPNPNLKDIALQNFPTLAEIDPYSQILWDTYQNNVIAQCNESGLKKIAVYAKKGDTIIWHPHMPHGGSEIKNIKRTRHSLVLHVTPKNTAVYHQDAFFDQERELPSEKAWAYKSFGHREYIDHGVVGLGHGINVAAGDFK